MANIDWRAKLRQGVVIPAHPLVLTKYRTLDEQRQTRLTRYYIDAGAGGIAVGVHTTQFAIREKGLYKPVLALAADAARDANVVRIAVARLEFTFSTPTFARIAVAPANTADSKDQNSQFIVVASSPIPSAWRVRTRRLAMRRQTHLLDFGDGFPPVPQGQTAPLPQS